MALTVLVADDHPVFRAALAAMLDGESELSVVATAGTGREAADAADAHRPDVAVLDLRMPDGDGLTATAAVRRRSPCTRVLVLTTFDGPDEVSAALAAGAHGYVLKSADPDEIVHAVRSVGAGTAVLSDSVLAGLARHGDARTARLFPELTEREAQVLTHLAHGMSTDEAARRLGVSDKTVRNHVATLTAKLHVRGRTEAVVLARDRGVGGPR